MKLNLLPSHVAKSQGSKGMLFFMIVIILLAAGLTFVMIKNGQQQLADARQRADAPRTTVAQAMGYSQMADTVIQEVTNIDRNLKMTDAMLKHNAVDVQLYRDVMSYIPSFYRVTNMTATPAGADGCTVAMTGVLKTPEQYADLVAAIYRMPEVTSVARGGLIDTRPYVPSLNEQDQTGTPIRPGEANLSSDPEERMAQLIQRASGQPDGFLGQGGFGQEVYPKGAMPEWSTVTLTLRIARNIQTPNPRATINLAAGSSAGTRPASSGGPSVLGGR